MHRTEVLAVGGEVSIVNSVWQDFPRWDLEDEDRWRQPTDPAWTTYCSTITDPGDGAYPGFTVACRAPELGPVSVEVWRAPADPTDVVPLTSGLLNVSAHGVSVLNCRSQNPSLDVGVPLGVWPIQILVDSLDPARVGRVLFVLDFDEPPVTRPRFAFFRRSS